MLPHPGQVIALLRVDELQTLFEVQPELLLPLPVPEDEPEGHTEAPSAAFEDALLSNAVLRTRLKRLASRGIKAAKASVMVGASYGTVRAIYSDLAFKREVLQVLNEAFEDMDQKILEDQKSLDEQLEEAALDSFKILHSMLKGEEGADQVSTAQRIRIAEGFMDRNMQTSRKTTSAVLTAKALDAESLQRAACAAREMDTALQERQGGKRP